MRWSPIGFPEPARITTRQLRLLYRIKILDTFEQVLVGERIQDFAFQGETVYAAGDTGLFISDDGGRSWRTVRDFRDPSQPDRLVRPDARVFSVATTRQALWAGTGDGLFRSTDGGEHWQLFRAEIPTNPESPTDAVPRVDTYAFPNPFSPASDVFLRLRYDLAEAQEVTVRIFDFGMNLIRTLVDGTREPGTREETWDGMDDQGIRVANGPYFYAIQTRGNTFWGKILVLE